MFILIVKEKKIMWSKLCDWCHIVTCSVIISGGDKRVAIVTVILAVIFCILSFTEDE